VSTSVLPFGCLADILRSDLHTSSTLLHSFSTALTNTTAQIRAYVAVQQGHILDVHRHYSQQLTSAREELVEAQITHQRWQESLGRLSEGVRGAYREREEALSGPAQKGDGGGKKGGGGAGGDEDAVRSWRAKVAGLREENRVLRKMVGWEEAPPDSDEEPEPEEVNVEGTSSMAVGVESGVGVGV
jgi:hypothetical protein